MLGWTVMSRELVSCGKAFAAAVALEIHLSARALWAFAQAGCSVGSELPLGAEALATLLAVVLLLGKMETKVVFHCKPVRICRVANIAVVLSNFVKVLVIGQAARMAVSLSTFFTGKRPPCTFGRIKLLGSGSTG